MKKLFILSILTIITFGILTISTAKIETPFDGNDTYGFPLTFFIRFSGMCSPCPPNATEVFYFKLLADILIAFILALFVWMIYKKTIEMVRKGKNNISNEKL